MRVYHPTNPQVYVESHLLDGANVGNVKQALLKHEIDSRHALSFVKPMMMVRSGRGQWQILTMVSWIDGRTWAYDFFKH